MEQFFKFEELRVYQKAIDFSFTIYSITKSWPTKYQYNLIDQLLRAALSISLNIAEGSGRSNKDFKHFLSIARGSCYECIPLITIAERLKFISAEDKKRLYQELLSLSKMLSSLRNSI